MKKILFVCTGNTCRSPMAEAIFNRECEQRNISARASSAGIYSDGSDTSLEARQVILEHLGLTIKEKSSPVTLPLVLGADFIVPMSPAHANALVSLFPDANQKLLLLSAPVPDPYMGGISAYESTFECLSREINLLIERLEELA